MTVLTSVLFFSFARADLVQRFDLLQEQFILFFHILSLYVLTSIRLEQ